MSPLPAPLAIVSRSELDRPWKTKLRQRPA